MIWLRAKRVLVNGEARTGWCVGIDAETIAEVRESAPPGAAVTDLGDLDLVPGFVDLHSDCLEELAHPRPTAELPLEETFFEYDSVLVNHGITTNFACVTLDDDARKWRTAERALETTQTLHELKDALRADHRIHLRVDVTADVLETMRAVGAAGNVSLLSYMDHRPGSGQFATEDEWRRFYGRNRSEAEQDRILAQKLAGLPLAETRRVAIADFAHEIGAALASHDDDSPSAVARAVALGVSISEFPVNAPAARAAIDAELGTLMGAPNARRGRSHVNNLSAREALAMGVLSALGSDYHPPSLVAAAYELAEQGCCSWAEGIALISSGPAKMALLGDRGRIEAGLRADLVAIDPHGRHPVIRQTWVGGIPALGPLPAAVPA